MANTETTKIVKKEQEPDDETDAYVRDLSKRLDSALGESPRAMIIVMIAHIDTALARLLKAHLVIPSNAQDSLFDIRSTRPLANLKPRIDLAFRMGLISGELSGLMHELASIRNECSHTDIEVNFEAGPIKIKIDDLATRIKGVQSNWTTKAKMTRIFTLILINLEYGAESPLYQVRNQGPEHFFKRSA